MHAPWAFKEKHIGLNISGTKELVPKNFFSRGLTTSSPSSPPFQVMPNPKTDISRDIAAPFQIFSEWGRLTCSTLQLATGRSDGPKGSDPSSGDTVTSLRRGKSTLALLNCDIVDFQISVN